MTKQIIILNTLKNVNSISKNVRNLAVPISLHETVELVNTNEKITRLAKVVDYDSNTHTAIFHISE